jgi:hypothetical protein
VAHAPEPLVCGADETGQMALNILDVVQLARERVLDVNDDDLPVGLALVEECHDTKDLNLLDLADEPDLLADFADVEGVVVALSFGLSVGRRRVLPGLHTHKCADQPKLDGRHAMARHLWECTVVPDVSVVGEAVANEAEAALLDVLLDGVERLLLGYLHLRVRPSRDFDHHIQDAIVLVRKERDIVPRRDDGAALFREYTVLCVYITLAGPLIR